MTKSAQRAHDEEMRRRLVYEEFDEPQPVPPIEIPWLKIATLAILAAGGLAWAIC